MQEIIQSRQNPRVKMLSKLQERSGRRDLGRFAIEGLRELQRAILAETPIEEIYFCPELFKSKEHNSFIETLPENIELCQLGKSAFEKVSNRQGCDGILAVSLQWSTQLSDIEFNPNMPTLILIAVGIEKPGNLGALLRSANAVKADAVILADSVVDLFNPAVIRSSQGALFSMQIANASHKDTVKFLDKHNIKPCAMALQNSNIIWQQDLSGSIAIIVGSEKDGLSQEWIESSATIKLPMYDSADSLNVNVAAAIALYEKRRIDAL
ncbi:MAG: TrmH family RNA methyltransferase [Opitutales bacterium]